MQSLSCISRVGLTTLSVFAYGAALGAQETAQEEVATAAAAPAASSPEVGTDSGESAEGPAKSEANTPAAKGPKALPDVTLDGYFRVRWNAFQKPNLSKGKPDYWQHRLRLLPTLKFKDKFTAKADLIFGQTTRAPYTTGVLGASGAYPSAVAQAEEGNANLQLVRFWGEVLTPFGLLKVGRQPSQWALGVVANDGLQSYDFGDQRYGDTYDRISFTTKPLGRKGPLTLVLIYDRLAENALNSGSDDMHEGVLVLHFGKAGYTAGVYQVFRTADTPSLQINVSDFWLGAKIGPFKATLEAALIYGNLELPTPPAGALVEQDVFQIGLAFEGIYQQGILTAKLRAGYASGDEDSIADSKLNQFKFDPEYRVGLLMFTHVARATLSTATDPFDYVTNAIYVNPIVAAEIVSGLTGKLGLVWATSAKDMAYGPATLSGSYGFEIDAGVDYAFRGFVLGLQGGALIPGDYFDQVSEKKTALGGQLRMTYNF